MSCIASVGSKLCVAKVIRILWSDKEYLSKTDVNADWRFESVADMINRITVVLHYASIKH